MLSSILIRKNREFNNTGFLFQSIPSEMQFCPNINPPCYKSKEEEVVIAQEDKIRLKIVGTRVDATGIVSVPYPFFFPYPLTHFDPGLFLVRHWHIDGRLLGLGVQLGLINWNKRFFCV